MCSVGVPVSNLHYADTEGRVIRDDSRVLGNGLSFSLVPVLEIRSQARDFKGNPVGNNVTKFRPGDI